MDLSPVCFCVRMDLLHNASVSQGQAGVEFQAVERLLQYFPANPLQETLAQNWILMTSRFSAFQIATFGSLILHEVSRSRFQPFEH